MALDLRSQNGPEVIDVSSDGCGLDAHEALKPRVKRRRTSSNPLLNKQHVSQGALCSDQHSPSHSQQASIARRNSKGGKLRSLINMPIDIFVEVCFHLDPHDLRRLSFTCKRIRDILMAKEARYIWRRVLQSVPDLPECPTNFTEPQYVRLLYSAECFTPDCTGRGSKVDFFNYVRFCTDCWSSNMLPIRDAAKNSSLPYILRMIMTDQRQTSSRSCRPSLYIQDLKEIESNYKLIKDQESATSLDALQKELKEFFQTRGSFSDAIAKWRKTAAASRADQRAATKQARFDSIKTNLGNLGWEEEDYPMDRKEFQDLVYRAQKLTSKVWETIKPRLESMLVERRNEQRAILRASRRMSFEQLYFQTICRISELPYELLTWNPYFPRPELVWGLPFIQSHLVQDTKSNDWEEKITSDLQLFALLHWSRFLADLVGILDGRTTNALLYSDPRFPQSFEAPDTSAEQAQAAIIASKQRLSLATSGFVCKCGVSPSVMWLPDVLRHGLEHRDWKYPQDFLKCLVPFNYRAPGLVESLLRNRLSDPRTTTIDELSEGIDWLCLRCPPYTTRYYSFREMIEHYLIENGWYNIAKAAAESSAGGSQTTYCLFNDHDWSEGGLLARQDDTYTQLWLGEMMQADCMKTFTCEYPTSADYNLKKVSCALCPPGCGPLPDYLPNIRAHILQKHNKELDPSTDISDATLNVYLSAI